MALVVKDRVKETTSTTGTGTLTLGGAVTGFQTFTSVLSNSDTTYYAIFESSTGQFEVGLGTFTSSGTTLARTTVLESSNSGNAINLTAGAADVFITQPAEKSVYLDSSGHIAAADGRNVTNVAASTATTAATVTTAAQPNITSLGTLTTLTVDDITINGSTISDGGDLTVDVGGAITLDADSGYIDFADGGTTIGRIENSSSDFKFEARVQDKDILFVGNDGGSGITALQLDMADAGTAIFNHDIKLGDNSKALFGASSDLEVYHNGTNSVIYDNGTGNLQLVSGGASVDIIKAGGENMATFATDGAATLYYDNSAKLATTSTGISINGDNYISMQENHFINRRFEMDAADNASPVYILLCLNAGSNDVNGTITMDRTSALKHACSWNMIVSSGSSTTPIGSLMGHGVAHAGQPSARLVTLTYSSVSYVALELTNPDAYHETTGAYFNGRIVNSGSNTLTPKIASAVTSVSALAQGNSKAVIGNTLSVGDITISGSTISDAADLTIDVGGVMSLDANGGNIRFKNNGTQFGTVYQSSSNLVFQSDTSDGDIVISGNDGGSYINALTLDMSDAGTATFNHDIKLAPSGGDVFIYYNGAKWLSTPSNALYLSLGDSGGNPWSGNTGTRLMFGSADTSAIDGYYIGTNLENYGGNYNKLDIDYATGIRLKANKTYGGTRFYDAHNDALLLSVGAGNTDVEVANNLIIPSNLQHAGDNDTMLQFSDANTIRLVAGNTETFKTTSSAVTISVDTDINGDLNAVDNIYLADRIYHEGDTNTYVGFNSADAISLHAGGWSTLSVHPYYLSCQGSIYNYYAYFDESSQLTGTTPTINAANSGVFYITLSGNTTFTFTNTSSGWGVGFILYLTGNGSTVTWPGTVDWAGGTAPDAPANGETDVLVFTTRDGSNWFGALAIDAAG